MYFLIFLLLAILLAIPTFGISLLVFIVAKNWFDKRAMSSLLGAAVTAMREGVSQERYHINRAAILKVFSRFSDKSPEVHSLGDRGVTLYWGLVHHPMINDNEIFSVRFAYIPRHGTSNTVFIKAATGYSPEVLSADDLNAFLFSPVASKNSAGSFDNASPGSDSEIMDLIVKQSEANCSDTNFPKFRYGDILYFATKHSNGTEWFENFRGMHFWVDIGEYEYYVYVSNLSPAKESDGGISMSVKLEGPAQRIGAAAV